MKRTINIFSILLLGIFSVIAFGDDSIPLRVGGTYLVKKIRTQGSDSFHIDFESVEKSGRFDLLTLETDHVHVAVKEGETIRLSAQVAEEKGATAIVSQVLIFIPNALGPVPVWLLSKNQAPKELNGARYIEMHSPLTDYLVL